jgi:hypothetical protein
MYETEWSKRMRKNLVRVLARNLDLFVTLCYNITKKKLFFVCQ